jgi:polygalacturonase
VNAEHADRWDVRSFGAAGDGSTHDTRAIQRAIDACGAAGGGTVWITAGAYVTGALILRSHVTLHLEAGATLLGSEDPADYPVIRSRWEGVEQETHAPLIGGSQLERIAVVGRGTVDGRGAAWWRSFRDGVLRYPRPRLFSFEACQDVLIEGLSLARSPSWTIHPLRCRNVTIDKVTIANPPDSPNTDGINPDSCRDVHVSNCHIDVGDDCIAIKSGAEAGDPRQRTPCENVTITNCTMVHGHGGVVIGSEMSGGVRNIVIANCVFEGTDRGIRLKSRRGRGGIVEEIRVTNVIMTGVLCPFTVNLYYACGAWGDRTVADKQPHAVTAGTPSFRRIYLSHISARDVRLAAGFLYGLPEMPVEDVALDDVSISVARDAEPGYPEMADDMELMQGAGLYARHVRGLRLHNVEVTGQRGPALLIDPANVAVTGSLGDHADSRRNG